MTRARQIYVKAAMHDILCGYSYGRVSYVEAVEAIVNRWRRGELEEDEAEYGLRVLARTKGQRA